MGKLSQIMDIRKFPEAAEKREEAATAAGYASVGCGLAGVVSAAAGVANLIAQRSFPLLTALSLATLAFREGAVFFHNVEAVMSDQETNGWDPKLVSHGFTEGTWLVDFLFRTMIERELRPN